MKPNSRIYRTILLIWILSFIIIEGIPNLIKTISLDLNKLDENVEIQGSTSFYNLTGTVMKTNITHYGYETDEEKYITIAGILIDDTLENFTWSETTAVYPWCTGSGTETDPYIIDHVYIDGQYRGKDYSYYSNILIRHSRAHFIIRNCSLHKSGVYADWNAGIFLYNTTNGIIIDNNFTFNRASIQLFESPHNVISFNYMISNHDAEVGLGPGISLGGYGNGNGSRYNTVTDNILINHYSGIVCYDGTNEFIHQNFINNTLFGHFPDTGIYLVDTNYSTITYNVFAGDYEDYANPYGDYIINQQNCVGNDVSNNFESISGLIAGAILISQSAESWFSLENSNYNYIYGNRFFHSNPDQIISGYVIFLILSSGLLSLIIVSSILKKKIS